MAFELVRSYLAACVHLRPVGSVYRWKGELHEDMETMMEIRTTEDLLADTISRISDIHPYELPVIEWRRSESTEASEEWVRAVTAKSSAKD